MRSSITILQYNTHQFQHTAVGLDPDQLYNDQVRLAALQKKLLTLQPSPQIISLVEVWGRASQAYLERGLVSTTPVFMNDNTDNPASMGSGLLLLSAQQLVAPSAAGVAGVPTFEPFRELSGADRFSAKGFLTVKVNVGAGGFWLITTHTQADETDDAIAARADNLLQIKARIDTLTKATPGVPIVVVGDLNVIGEADGRATDEYRRLAQAMLPLRDAFRAVHPSEVDDPGYTYDGTTNSLIRRFAPGDAQTRQRLDYLFCSPGIQVTAAQVCTDFQTADPAGGPMDLSDHYPLLVSFNLDIGP